MNNCPRKVRWVPRSAMAIKKAGSLGNTSPLIGAAVVLCSVQFLPPRSRTITVNILFGVGLLTFSFCQIYGS
ncbi:hypothetical protein C8R43DRAFT_1017415, partial [Mycena crocata]